MHPPLPHIRQAGPSQPMIQFPRMLVNDSEIHPPSSPPPSGTLPTPPRRTHSHTPRISSSPQARNAIYIHSSKNSPSTIRSGPPPVADPPLVSFFNLSSSATVNFTSSTKSSLVHDASTMPRKTCASLSCSDGHGSRGNLVSPHPSRDHPPPPPLPRGHTIMRPTSFSNRLIRPCLSSPAISHSTTAPPSSTIPPSQSADPRKSRRYCTDWSRYGQDHTQQVRQAQPSQHPRSPSFSPPHAPGYDAHDHYDDMRSNASSAELTPLATYADSDVSSSSFDHEHDSDLDLQFAFPRPPQNPTISGRMEDFPPFTEQETDSIRAFLKKWEASVAARRIRSKEKKLAGGKRDEEEGELLWEASPSLPRGEEVERAGLANPNSPQEDEVSFVLHSLRGGLQERHSGNASEHALGREGPQVAVPCITRTRREGNLRNNINPSAERQEERPSNRTTIFPEASECKAQKGTKTQRNRKFTPSLPSSARVPRIIRKVASMSMKGPGNHDSNGIKRGHIPDVPTRLAPKPSMPALSRSEETMPELQQYHGQPKPHRIDPTAQVEFSGAFPYLERSGGKHLGHRPQASAPLESVSLRWAAGSSPAPRPRTLATPFTHRPTQSQSAAAVRSGDRTGRSGSSGARGLGIDDERLKSFMDITPEQDKKCSSGGAQKEKMRKLLARASNGILGWGKSFGRKKVVAH